MWLGNWQRKYQCCHYPWKLILRRSLAFPSCAPHACEHQQLGCEATRETMPHLLLPSDPPFSQRKEDGLNSWTLLKQEPEITRSNHALKIRYERATQCSRKKWTMSCQYSETHLLHPFKDQPNAHTCSMLLFLALGEILGRCFTLVRFMSLWPWECPWE